MMRSSFVLAWVLVGVVAALAGAQSRPNPPLALASLTGRDSFDLYCASCHGSDARGSGPVAPELRTRPADLTTLARGNAGVFPRQRVAGYVEGTGRQVPAHGAGGMPVWGMIFRGLESDVRTKVRLSNLVAYVESLQLPGDDATPVRSARMTGAEIFRSYCASCHGAAGRGDGALVGQLRRMPPDLTQFTARNGGMFPSERLRAIIDGRDVAAHGDRSMPVWGDVFTRQRNASDDTAAERIEALVAFLQSIQARAAE